MVVSRLCALFQLSICRRRMKRIGKMKKSEAVERKTFDVEDFWKVHVEKISEMRKTSDAPVDTMGCHKLADPLVSPETFHFQVLMALMLSSQTRDDVTSAAMMITVLQLVLEEYGAECLSKLDFRALITSSRGTASQIWKVDLESAHQDSSNDRLRSYGCNVDSMLAIPTAELEKLLYPVSFYKRKAIYIQKAAAILKEKYNGDVPDTFEDLCSLPGVGPKMAHLVLQVAYNKVDGIAVDTHVHRIVNRLGWVDTNTPERTRVKLEEMLPRSQWETINPLLVGFGQKICLPVGPKCDICLCKDICPSARLKTTKIVSKEVELTYTTTEKMAE